MLYCDSTPERGRNLRTLSAIKLHELYWKGFGPLLMKMVLLMLEVKTILSFREGFRQELHLGGKIVEVFEISYIVFLALIVEYPSTVYKDMPCQIR